MKRLQKEPNIQFRGRSTRPAGLSPGRIQTLLIKIHLHINVKPRRREERRTQLIYSPPSSRTQTLDFNPEHRSAARRCSQLFVRWPWGLSAAFRETFPGDAKKRWTHLWRVICCQSPEALIGGFFYLNVVIERFRYFRYLLFIQFPADYSFKSNESNNHV